MSRYNPDKHHRRSIRLRGYDYTQAGAYFVTIVTHNREPLFGDVVDGEMVLTPYGRVAATMWQRIPRHFPHVELDEWVVMPNHVHGIIVITDVTHGRGGAFPVKQPDGAGSAHGEQPLSIQDVAHGRGDAFPAKQLDGAGSAHGEKPLSIQISRGECVAPTGPPSGSLGAIVGNFKSVTTRRINRMRKAPGMSVWQRNYYERVVRNERELNAIRQYICDNPTNWLNDTEHPVTLQRP